MAIDKAKEKAIRAAVAPVLEKIGADRERVDAELQGFLDYLADNLLYQKATIAEGLRCSGANKGRLKDFKAATGITTGAYIKDCKMEVVGRLLRADCRFTMEEIAEIVGYAESASLCRGFESWSGQKPTEFRERYFGRKSAGVESPDLKFLRTGWAHGIEFERADTSEIEEFLRGIFEIKNLEGSHFPTENPLLVAEEWFLAGEFGRWLIELPAEERAERIQLADVFQSTALFEYLLEQSRVQGRGDRERGVWIAELALESLKGLTWRLSAEEMVHQRIRGLAYLGNALRLSIDFSGAEKAFSEVGLLANVVSTAPPVFQAEVVFFKACLRMNQRRREEALSLAENALTHLSRDGHIKLRVEAMTLIGSIQGLRGCWFEALRRFRAAGEQAKGLRDPYLLISVESGLVWANIKMGNLAAANVSLCKAFGLVETHNQATCSPYLHWLKGIYAAEKKELEQATESLSEALTDFQEQKNYGYAAAVALEMAIMLSWQDRYSEVLETASLSLSILKELELDDESLVLIATLKTAVEKCEVEVALLHRFRSRLGAELGLLDLLRRG